jgi:(1->4)-alpha-D-glucan 1-alpha-D-glucosylmutase
MRGVPDAERRITDHIAKALREAKDLSRHEAPEEDAESRAAALCTALLRDLENPAYWPEHAEPAYRAAREGAILAQAAFQLTAPGIPDIYQGTEWTAVALTDPDNRRAIDWDGGIQDDLSARKLALTRQLLAERAADPELFARGSYALRETAQGWTVTRALEDRRFTFDIAF